MAAAVVTVLGVYVVAGVLFAAVFVARGIERIDAAAVGAGIGFRLIVFPGAAALWPVLLRRSIAVRRHST